jgi:thiol-disulfide isomerase/thioredoxin
MDTNVVIGLVIGAFLLLLIIGVVVSNSSDGPGYGKRNGASSCSTGTCQSAGGQKGGQVVLFYAPWCGFCKDIKPTWKQLEKSFPGRVVSVNSEKKPDLVKRFKIDGFPTIYFCPKGQTSKSGAVLYEGDRSKKDLERFIKRHLN